MQAKDEEEEAQSGSVYISLLGQELNLFGTTLNVLLFLLSHRQLW